MTEEIKEILEEIDNKIIPNEHWNKVKDYITIIQQENEFLKLNNPEMNIEHFRIVKENKRKIDNLRKENKELKAIAEEHKNCTRKHWQQKCGEHHAKELIYKSRCEKAIEYINFVINHYKEQLETPIEYTYFDSDVNRKGYILSIIAYLQTALDTLIGSDENE